MKPDDKTGESAEQFLTTLLPEEIRKLREQVQQGGLPLDVWGDFGDRDRLANAYKGGPGPAEGIASLTGDGRGINQALVSSPITLKNGRNSTVLGKTTTRKQCLTQVYQKT